MARPPRGPLGSTRLLGALACLLLVAAACSDDDGSDDDGGGEDAATTTEAPAATDPPASGEQDEDDGSTGPGWDPGEPRVVTHDGAATDAPDEFDVVTVVEQGDPAAENVLVLVPGTSAGAGYFLPLGEDIVDAAPDWQVWSVDRRENLLEDHSVLDQRKAGDGESQEVFDYYLGWLVDDTITDRFEPHDPDDVAFARDWGMAVAVDDLRPVVREAAGQGGQVVLAGHSLGANITVAYATWDFDGTPGFEDLAGIGLIDGGSRPVEDAAEVEAQLAELEAGQPFNDLLGLGAPWAPGVFNALGSTGVLLEPDEPSISYEFPLLPEVLKPPVRPTNEGQYGYALDVDTSPDNLALVHLSMGSLAEEGRPRGWVDDGPVPIRRAARMFSGIEGIDGTAWYHPLRLTIDGRTTNGGIPDPVQELTGVRSVHGADLTVPIYAFETGFGAGRVLAGARLLAEQAGLDDGDLVLVEGHDLTHTDPMAIEDDNPLVETLVPFLESIAEE
jgi:pimeloyl-ACP methyl ester carboxylesterase